MLRPVHDSALPPSIPGGGYLTDDGAGNYSWVALGAIESLSTSDPNRYTPAAGSSNNVLLDAATSLVNIFDTTAGAVTFTGFDATDMGGKLVYIANAGPNAMLIPHQDGGSLAANRVIGPDDADLSIPKGYGCRLFYDTVATRWRVLP